MMFSILADVLKLIWWAIIGLFQSRASMEAEVAARLKRRDNASAIVISQSSLCSRAEHAQTSYQR